MKRYCYIMLSAIAIAFLSTSLEAKENYSEISAKNFFVCSTETLVPTLYVYKSGQTSLTPLISWHEEYLLPQDSGSKICKQVAQKLQHLAQEPGQQYITTEEKAEHTLVCTVKVADETFSSNYSEPLFALNPYYDAQCILDRKEPLECVMVGRVRGVFSIPDSPYKPIWWLW